MKKYLHLRLTALALSFLLLFSLSACGTAQRVDPPATDPICVPETEPPATDPFCGPETDPPVEVDTNGETIPATEPPEAAEPTLYDDIYDAWQTLLVDDPTNISHYSGLILPDYTAVSHALITGDGAALAEALHLPSEVYACYDGLAVSDWSVRLVTFDYYGSLLDFPALDITVTESNVPALPVGQHTLVFEDGPDLHFFVLEEPVFERPVLTSAEQYAKAVINKSTQFGIVDFIAGRLNSLTDGYGPYTAEEIKEYARVCLDMEVTEEEMGWTLETVDGGYRRIGRGTTSQVMDYIGEEEREGVTVVTVRFWADHSMTVEAKVVEYHMVMTEIDWKLVDTVVLSDSGFEVAGYST